MTIRLIGALLCGAAFLFSTPINLAQAQSATVTGRVTNTQGQADRNNTVQGNFIGTSTRGVIVSPYQTGGHEWGEGRRRSKGTQRLLNNDVGVGYARTTAKSSKSNTGARRAQGRWDDTDIIHTRKR